MNKLSSRKFWVWIASLAIVIITIIITKSISPEVINMYSLVSCLYLGSNTAINWIRGVKDDPTGKNN